MPRAAALMAGPDSGVASEATGRMASPGTPRASRLVTRIRTPEQERRTASARSAPAVRTGSQSSRTSSSFLSARWSSNIGSNDRPAGSVRPSVLTTSGSSRPGAVSAPHSTTQVPSSNRSRSCLANRRPIRVLPTPPGPVSVRSDARSSIEIAWAISRSRPMKLVTSSLRLLRRSSVVRGGGKSRSRPGPVIWYSRCGGPSRERR